MRTYAALDPVFSQLTNEDEYTLTQKLLDDYPAHLVDSEEQVLKTAIKLVESIRGHAQKPLSVEGFLQTYPLSSPEGRALMCLAEALLRIPDANTQLALMRDKLGTGNWHPNHPETTTFLNKLIHHTLSWTDSLLNWGLDRTGFLNAMSSLTRRFTDPLIRQSIRKSMMVLGQQFVFGQTIEEALKHSLKASAQRYAYDFDMLGEAAKTAEDAQRYFEAYCHAIRTLAQQQPKSTLHEIQYFGVSIKLSALHPRYEVRLKDRVFEELYPKLCEIVQLACQCQIPITLDAEEAERLELSLELLQRLLNEPWIQGWHGLGLAIQTYQKCAAATIDWVIDQARKKDHPIRIRLVKGAYWDTEIKLAQERGLTTYPVFTEKHLTDLNYLLCADKMFAAAPYVYPQFATHNAYTVASVIELHKKYQTPFEFQRLHGMGADLYAQIIDDYPCRIYAPVGQHKDLLAYLIRRLLENGANSSFLNKLYDTAISPQELLQHPRHITPTHESVAQTYIPLPPNIYPDRRNSQGLDITRQDVLQAQQEHLNSPPTTINVRPSHMVSHHQDRPVLTRHDPAKPNHLITEITCAHQQDLEQCLDQATTYQEVWAHTSIQDRARMLEKLADLIEQHQDTFIQLLTYEAGKVLSDNMAEIREAVDFCRFYAQQARQALIPIQPLPGPTGETNELSFAPRGVFVCISPWNFPLAIFLGQVAAALVAGNVVIAKPAMQTTAIAQQVVQLAYKAGIPKNALYFMPAPGTLISQVLLDDPRVSGVVFTGSTETARQIQRTIAERPGPIIPLIAETGGLNAMIVDASALPEQVVTDIVTSAFQSAGQRCSALRILYVQEEVKDRICTMLAGAMAELQVGPPQDLATDIGPVVDQAAWQNLQDYTKELSERAVACIAQTPLPEHLPGYYIAPQAWLLEKPEDLKREIFGPILHVVTYAAGNLEDVVRKINASGYGLTLGVHSRIQTTVDYVRKHARVGNLYVNRNIIGAVVGSQPFGGEGLSGTGFKAGGPHYLLRFVTERAFCEDTTASGGNVTLLCAQPTSLQGTYAEKE